ncbi:hypothetical protein [Hydrogenophaga sp.]|uniref:hypothetical protein n=1 Tax=Hydrogenophaga sp. TaxID=1904254 RepID=UPI003F6BA6D2
MSTTFSETWHRVSQARLSLLPTVAIHKQRFRGEDWYVLRDAYTQRFFRIRPMAYLFVSRLSHERTVDEVWRSCLDDFPQEAPGQEDAMQVLSQLHHSNLLHYRSKADSQAIFERYRTHRQREIGGQLLGFLYLRVPLWDPNAWLNRQRAWVERLVAWPAAAVLIGVLLAGGLSAILNSHRLWDQSQGLFAIDNLIWLYLCMAVMKILHELGHAFVVKKFGGEVHTMGLMFLVFMPLPYVDATASWGFRSRYARALVGAAGIIVELFLAALGAMVWASTGPGLVNSLAFNVMVIGSVSSLLFNGNPLLRFDAYYVLSDLLDIPNLYQKSSQQWFYFADKYLLGTEKAESPARDRREWWHMTLYGLFSFFYRMLIVATILLFVTDQWFAVGVVFAFTTLVMLVVMPAKKWIAHLTGGAVYRNRRRAVVASLALVLLPSAVVLWLPLPYAIRVPGMVEALQYTRVTAASSGRLESIVVPSGTPVLPGQLLLVLASPELDWELEIAQQQSVETQMLLSMALGRTLSDIVPLQQRLASLSDRMAELRARKDALAVRARHPGVWFSPQLGEKLGNWLPRGELLGEVVDNSRLRFTAVVSQEQANQLFRDRPVAGALRLNGQADQPVDVQPLVLLPYQKQQLASAALGWNGGGSIPVRPDDPQGLSTVDTFYEVQAPIPADQAPVAWHGMAGWMRIPLQYQSLAEQLGKAFMQLLQKRYQL